MNLTYELLAEPFSIEQGGLYNLTIENLCEYREVLTNLDNNSKIQIYKDDKLVADFCVIYDIINYDFYDKKIINKVGKDIAKISDRDEFYIEKNEISSQLISYVSRLVHEYSYPLTFSTNFDINYLIKSCGVTIDCEYSSFLEKFINILQIQFDIFKTFIIYTNNITLIFDEEELIEISNYAKTNDIVIINIDRVFIESKAFNNRILIDSDLCRIL